MFAAKYLNRRAAHAFERGGMTHRRSTVLSALVVTSVLGATAPAAPAQAQRPTLGTHVSLCARDALGQRPAPPSVSCDHDGHVHAFANFGAMVEHLREHHQHAHP